MDFNGEHLDGFKGHPCLVGMNYEPYIYFGYVQAISPTCVVLRQAQCFGSEYDSEDIVFWATEGVAEQEGVISDVTDLLYLANITLVVKCTKYAVDSISVHENTYREEEENYDETDVQSYDGLATDSEEELYYDEEEETNSEFAPPEELLPVANVFKHLDEMGELPQQESDYTNAYDDGSYEETDREEQPIKKAPPKRRRRRR